MKICLFGISELKPGKYNVKDPRLDKADQLVEAKKKTYVQVDLAGEEDALEADAILATRDSKVDLILKDLEYVETRLGREPVEPERSVLTKIQARLENEEFIINAGLSPEDLQAVTVHAFYTNKPVVVADPSEFENPDALLGRALHESGYISYLTLGGKENRAWLIRKGMNAAEAAGVIHSDMQKGFIRAEIIAFDDLVQCGGETQAKRAGKLRLETKQYLMQDCDVTNFRFNK